MSDMAPLTPDQQALLALATRIDTLAADIQHLASQVAWLTRDALARKSTGPVSYWLHPP